jgi:hypothetical protein
LYLGPKGVAVTQELIAIAQKRRETAREWWTTTDKRRLFDPDDRDRTPLFCGASGRPRDSQLLNEALSRILLIGGVDAYRSVMAAHTHELRHTIGSLYYRLSGGNAKLVGELMGNSDAVVLRYYAHVSTQEQGQLAMRAQELRAEARTDREVTRAGHLDRLHELLISAEAAANDGNLQVALMKRDCFLQCALQIRHAYDGHPPDHILGHIRSQRQRLDEAIEAVQRLQPSPEGAAA